MNKIALWGMMGIVAVGVGIGLTTIPSVAFADNDSIVDQVQITVPTACSMSGVVDTAHNRSLQPDTYSGAAGIGKTTLTAVCNDNNGFSIYAIGFTGDTDGDNTLVGASSGEKINTGIYSSGSKTSSWSMKVSKVSDSATSFNPQNMTIMNNFDNWHLVPSDYAKVAEYKASTGSSTTDTVLGAKIETTYDAYASVLQRADSYTGKVKYVMVHPYNASAPEKVVPTQSSCPTSPMISTVAPNVTYMQDINSGNKATVLSSLTVDATYQIKDNRDNETYCVGKLQDGKLWLLDNLALDLTDSTILSGINGTNTNASNATLNYLKNGGGADNNKYANSAVGVLESANTYSDPRMSLIIKDSVPSDLISQTGGYKVGGYYNYCAASAGSYCYGFGVAGYGDATEDICPAGWRMPTSDGPGDYSTLYGMNAYNTYDKIRRALHLPLNGRFDIGGPINMGGYAYFWSSSRFGDYAMDALSLNSSYVDPGNDNSRNYGTSVRCVLNS